MSKQDSKTKSKKAPARKSAPKKQAAIQQDAIADAPMLEADDTALGTLSALKEPENAPKASAKRSVRKAEKTGAEDTPVEQEPPSEPVPGVLRAEPPTESEPELLKLARGGFIAFRKSGGLAFSTREVVIYPDGKVAYDARGVPQKEYNRLRRVLNDGQIISLRKLLDQTNFWKTESSGKQNPDAFAYEIAARIGQRSNELQVFDGSIPEILDPLIERLTKLLPE